MKTRILLFCLLGGAPVAFAGLGPHAPLAYWIGGSMMAAAFVPVVMYGPKSALAQFGLIGTALLFVTSFCTWTEAMVFMPGALNGHPWQALIGGSVFYVTAGAIMAILGRVLKLHVDSERTVQMKPLRLVPLFLVGAGVAYAVYYFIFGAITFRLYTYQFYADAEQMVAKVGVWFWPMQIGRGVLMTLSILPILYTLRLSRLKLALVAGAIAYIAGGAAPMMFAGNLMGVPQRIAHAIEIFTQNFPLGVTAAYLLTCRSSSTTAKDNVNTSHLREHPAL